MGLASFQGVLGFPHRNVRNARISHSAIRVSAEAFICVYQETLLARASVSLGYAAVPVSESSFIR